jgi:uncharacterized protein (TIGR02996 family)
LTRDEAFLQAIIDNPDDDAIRLVHADFLDDQGQSERAAFIRVQVELASLPEDDPRREELEDREQLLLHRHQHEWAEPLSYLSCHSVTFRRGFPEHIALEYDLFPSRADELFRAAPVRHVEMIYTEGWTDALASCSHLKRLTGLGLKHGHIGPEGVLPLLSWPHLARLLALDLDDTRLGPAGLQDLLARSHLLPELEELGLGDNWLEAEDVVRLASSPLAIRLKRLGLNNGIGWTQGRQEGVGRAGVQAVAAAASLSGLTSLDLGYCGAGDEGCEALAASPHLTRLTDLYLDGNAIAATGAEALFASPNVSRLRLLKLRDGNRIGEAGARALAGSPHLRCLRHLDLEGNDIGDGGAKALASSVGLGGLRVLKLYNNGIKRGGVRALVRSQFWPKLLALDLQANPLTDAAAKELLAASEPAQLLALDLRGTNISQPLQAALREKFGEAVCKFERE